MRIPRLTFYLLFSASCCLNNALQTAPNKKNKNLHHRRAPKEKPNSLRFVLGGVVVVVIGGIVYYVYTRQKNTGGSENRISQKGPRCYEHDLVWSGNSDIKLTSAALPVAWGECAKVHNASDDRKFSLSQVKNLYLNGELLQKLNKAQDHITDDLVCLGPEDKYVVEAGKGMGPVEAYNKAIDSKKLNKSLKFENLQIKADESVGIAGFELAVEYKQGPFDKIDKPMDFYNQKGEKVGQVANLFGTDKESTRDKEYYNNVYVLNHEEAEDLQNKKMFISLALKQKEYTLFMYTQNYTKEDIKKHINNIKNDNTTRYILMKKKDTFIAPCIDISVVDDFSDQNILLKDDNKEVKLFTAIDFKMDEKGAKATAKAAVYIFKSVPKARNLIFNVPYYIDIYATEAIQKEEVDLPLLSVKVDNPC